MTITLLWKHNIKKTLKSILVICILISMCFLNIDQLEIKVAAQSNLLPDYKLAASSDVLGMYIRERDGAIAIQDYRNGYIWKSVVDEDMYNLQSLNEQWQNYLNSVIVLNYIDIENRDAPPNVIYSSAEGTIVTLEYINDGVEVEYFFEPIGISVNIQFLLENDCFIVKIPGEKIREIPVTEEQTGNSTNKNREAKQVQYGIVSIELLPFFGAATNDVDGYLLYPDGPGGLTMYDQFKNRPADVKPAKWVIYSNDKVNVAGLFGEEGEKYRAHLPIMGIKNNDNAFLAAVTEGIAETRVAVYPSGYVVDINHINFELIYRHSYDLTLSDISIDNVSIGKNVSRVEKDLNAIDREIRYFMLSDEQANYSEMANTYRKYLINKGVLKDKEHDDLKLALTLNILMGITEDRMIFDKFIPMTTVSQVNSMIEELENLGVDNLNIILRGWQEKGYGQYPINWPFDSRLGTKKQIRSLNEYAMKDNINIYLENSFIYALDKVGGYSKRNDVVLDGIKLPVMDELNKAHILNPTAAAERNEKFLEHLSQYEGFNIAYEHLGKIIYFDYHRTNPSDREETVETWKRILKKGKESGRKIAVDGSNQYVFECANLIYNIPIEGYDYFITDKQIPFLQMVLHGYIPYTSQPGNLSHDLQIQKLKWIEYGCLPNFELTSEKTMMLKNTQYDHLFTSTFDNWKEKIVEIYREFKEKLSDLYKYEMVCHREVAPSVIEIKYSNGSKILINYSDLPFYFEGKEVPARDYLLITKE